MSKQADTQIQAQVALLPASLRACCPVRMSIDVQQPSVRAWQDGGRPVPEKWQQADLGCAQLKHVCVSTGAGSFTYRISVCLVDICYIMHANMCSML
jgi:hypothetical protein